MSQKKGKKAGLEGVLKKKNHHHFSLAKRPTKIFFAPRLFFGGGLRVEGGEVSWLGTQPTLGVIRGTPLVATHGGRNLGCSKVFISLTWR